MITIIAGPCQHESFQQSLDIILHCQEVCQSYGVEYYFKSSFDKANRTSLSGIRGLGFTTPLSDFKKIRKHTGVKILTDVHTVEQIIDISLDYNDTIDVLQIPAFLCRQTDLIQAACETDKIVNIKKGQFLAPWDVKGILSKTTGEVWITERGTSFGYNTLVVDFVGLEYMMNHYDCPIVLDITHSVQKPGGKGSSSGGNREYAPGLARAGSALGINHFFLEVHPDPDNAPSDGPNMIRLEDFDKVVNEICEYNYRDDSVHFSRLGQL